MVEFIVCSDIHYSSKPAYAEARISEYEEDGAFVCSCGDYVGSTGGILGISSDALGASTDPTQKQAPNAMRRLAALGGSSTGNHDASSSYPVTIEGLNLITGKDYSDFINEKVVGNDVFMFVCGELPGAAFGNVNNDAKRIYAQETRTSVLNKLAAYKAAGKQVMLFTHYPLELKRDGTFYSGFNERVDNYGFGYDVGPNRITDSDNVPAHYTWTGYVTYAADIDFYKSIASYDNVVWFSGHNHNYWKYETSEYGYANCHHIRARVEGQDGAYMVNVPSLTYSEEDCIVRIDDNGGITITPRRYSSEAGHMVELTESGLWPYTLNGAVPPEEPEEPTPPPSGGTLSVTIRNVGGRTITRYEELPAWVRERLENGAKLWYMADGIRHEVTWQQLEADYEYYLDGGVLTIVRAPCRVEGGVLKIE